MAESPYVWKKREEFAPLPPTMPDPLAIRAQALTERFARTVYGAAIMGSLQYKEVTIGFDRQMSPKFLGLCYNGVSDARVLLNERFDDATLAGTLAHELRHAAQPMRSYLGRSAETEIVYRALVCRLLEGDAFLCQTLFGLETRAEDPSFHEANMAFFRARLVQGAMTGLETACAAYAAADGKDQRTESMRAMYWIVQDYIADRYDRMLLDTLPDRLKPPEDIGYEESRATFFLKAMQRMHLPGYGASDYLGDPAAAVTRLRATFLPALRDKICAPPLKDSPAFRR